MSFICREAKILLLCLYEIWLERLEPYDGKLSRRVLRREKMSNYLT